MESWSIYLSYITNKTPYLSAFKGEIMFSEHYEIILRIQTNANENTYKNG